MTKDQWMSDFYGMDWFTQTDDALDDYPKGMIEWKIDAKQYEDIFIAQQKGFKLVETAVEFESEIKKPNTTADFIRLATEDDKEAIIEIIKICYFNHDKFYNRFKNKEYFTQEQANDYYLKSFTSFFLNGTSITVVAEDKEGVSGFYLMNKVGDNIYKGITTGVHPRQRGKNLHVEMQRKCYDIVGKDYVVINRTQLGNYQVLKNHIREQRELSKIEHIFYLKNA